MKKNSKDNLAFSFLIDAKDDASRPLADRLRPASISEVLGQEQVLGEASLLAHSLKNGHLPSVIFWGPPGCGKTTIARLLAKEIKANFVLISALSSGTSELREIFDEARIHKEAGKRTLLMVDEIHHFKRPQQDLFLPYLEDGTVILVGATTENPSFALNSALLSRAKVLVLNRLDKEALLDLLQRAETLMQRTLPLTEDARTTLCQLADGDGRYLLNCAEELFTLKNTAPLVKEALITLLQKRMPLYDKHAEQHYNIISALHKSLRGSDPDAALYWFSRMLSAGEDPHYIARRLVRFASEDVGLADSNALLISLAAWEAYTKLGSPEGDLALSQAVLYLATAPKSNANYVAFKAAMKDASETGSFAPPKHILNAPTNLMKELGYGKGYRYDHDAEDGFSGQNYFPEAMERKKYYCPTENGIEKELANRLAYLAELRKKKEES